MTTFIELSKVSEQAIVVPNLQLAEFLMPRPSLSRMRQYFRRRGLRRVRPSVYEVKGEPEPTSRAGEELRKAKRIVLGAPFESREEKRERLSKVTGLAAIGADNIASSVYGPEAMLRALAVAGAGAIALSLHVAGAILVLLLVVALSYRQTIRSYPQGGGSYIVTHKNLGLLPGLVAGCALMTDYVLDVAVSVAAGIQSLSSIFPSFHSARVWLCLALIVLLMLGNLRGIRPSGVLFAGPVYLYVLSMLVLIGWGIFQVVTGRASQYLPKPGDLKHMASASSAIGAMLFLRAFASGAVALTGVEAIANGVPWFRAPEVKNARITLVNMVTTFGLIFVGVSFLASRMHVLPDPREAETLVSRVAETVLGRNWLYYGLQISTALMLAIAANTAYVDFPRLASAMARDRFLPERFASRGERLVFSRGIIVLSILAAILVIVFQGSLEALIPLFTVGVFIAFTLSETSMVVHHWRKRERGWRWGIFINSLGMVTTGFVTCVEGITKFTRGAWIVLIVIPALVFLFSKIRAHFEWVDRQLRIPAGSKGNAMNIPLQHEILIPVEDINRVSLHAIAYAKSLTQADHAQATPAIRLKALHVSDSPEAAAAFQKKWKGAMLGIPLVVLQSPYRELINPILTYVDAIRESKAAENLVITVLVTDTVPPRWTHQLLHKKTAILLRTELYLRPRTTVISVPFHLPVEGKGEPK